MRINTPSDEEDGNGGGDSNRKKSRHDHGHARRRGKKSFSTQTTSTPSRRNGSRSIPACSRSGGRKRRLGRGDNCDPPVGGLTGDIPHGTVASRHRHRRNGHCKSEHSHQTTGSRDNAPPVSDLRKHQSMGPQRKLQTLYGACGGTGDVHN